MNMEGNHSFFHSFPHSTNPLEVPLWAGPVLGFADRGLLPQLTGRLTIK